jgi:tetratricopeptide (TPR) repeat protein
MDIIISVIIAIVLVAAGSIFGPSLPCGDLLSGKFYQVVAIISAIIISAIINAPMMYMLKGNSLYAKKQYKDALNAYKKAYSTKRLSPELSVYYAYTLLKEGKIQTAEKVFDSVKEKNTNDKQKNMFNTNYALLLWKKGNLDEAVELLKSCEKSAVSDGSLGALLLLQAEKSGDYSEAFSFCREVYEKYPYDKSAMCNMAEAYYHTGEYDKAEEIFSELIDMRPETPSPYYFYGLTLKSLGKVDDARDMFSKALRRRFTALTPISRKDAEKEAQDI